MLSNDLMASVKSVLGTCQAMGVLVENKQIKEINSEVEEGNFDAMVKAEKTEVDPEKRKELDEYFTQIKAGQDEAAKAAEAEAAAEAEEKEAEAGGEEAEVEATEEKKE